MKRPHQITGALVVLLAAVMTWQSSLLRFYTPMGPGPGFFPLLVSVGMGCLGLLMIYQATFQESHPRPADFFPSRLGALRCGVMVLGLVCIVVLMEPLGFRITMLGFMTIMLLVLGKQHPIVTAVVALGASFGTYALFVELLDTPLPIGMFGI